VIQCPVLHRTEWATSGTLTLCSCMDCFLSTGFNLGMQSILSVNNHSMHMARLMLLFLFLFSVVNTLCFFSQPNYIAFLAGASSKHPFYPAIIIVLHPAPHHNHFSSTYIMASMHLLIFVGAAFLPSLPPLS